MQAASFALKEEAEKHCEFVLKAHQSGKQINLFVLLDVSGSVNDADVKNALPFAGKVPESFEFCPGSIESSPTVLWMYQFANSVMPVIEKCTDKSEFSSAVLTMQRTTGGTNTYEALNTVLREHQRLQANERPDSQTIIVLLTDDDICGNCFQNQSTDNRLVMRDLYAYISNREDMQLEIIMLGQAQVPEAQRTEFNLRNNQILRVPQYQDLIHVVTIANRAVIDRLQVTPAPSIFNYCVDKFGDLYVSFEQQRSDTPQDMRYTTIEVQVLREDNTILDKTSLPYTGKNICLNRKRGQGEDSRPFQLQEGVNLKMRHRAVLRSGRRSKWCEKEQLITLKTTNIPKLPTQQDHAKIDERLQKIVNYQLPDKFKKALVKKLNVLFIGLTSAGKSSLIVTLQSIARGTFIETLVISQRSESVTSQLKYVPLSENTSSLQLLDVAGLEFDKENQQLGNQSVIRIENSNYSDGILKQLAKGLLKQGFPFIQRESNKPDVWTCKDPNKDRLPTYIKDEDLANLELAPHAICLVVNANSCMKQYYLDSVRVIQHAFQDLMGVMPVVAMTQIDKYISDQIAAETNTSHSILTTPEEVLRERQRVEALFDQFCTQSGGENNSQGIYPFCSQRAPENEKSYSRILMMCNLMEELIRRGQTRLEDLLRKSMLIKARNLGMNGRDIVLGRINVEEDFSSVRLTKKLQSRVNKCFLNSVTARQIVQKRNYNIRYVKVSKDEFNTMAEGDNLYLYETVDLDPDQLEKDQFLQELVVQTSDPLHHELLIEVEIEGLQQAPAQAWQVPVQAQQAPTQASQVPVQAWQAPVQVTQQVPVQAWQAPAQVMQQVPVQAWQAPAQVTQQVPVPQMQATMPLMQSTLYLTPELNTQTVQQMSVSNVSKAGKEVPIKVTVQGLKADGSGVVVRTNGSGTFADLRRDTAEKLVNCNDVIRESFASMRFFVGEQCVTDETVTLAQAGVKNNTNVTVKQLETSQPSAAAGTKMTVRFSTGYEITVIVPEDATLSDLRAVLQSNAQQPMTEKDSFCEEDDLTPVSNRYEDSMPVSEVAANNVVKVLVNGVN